MATQLSRTFSAGGNQRKFTISVWIKRTSLSQQSIFGSGGSGAYATRMYFDGSDNIQWWNFFNNSYAGRKYSTRKLRDTNGYYHCVFRCDTANSTASERMRMYVNGEEVTDLETNDNPSQNQTMEIGHTGAHYIGGYGTGADGDCIMSHFHYCDNQSYAPTEFGETDSTTGEWKIKVDPSVSYGTSGSFILEDGNSVTDQSGLGNNWTVASGTLTKTEDCPSNVFATLNPLWTQESTRVPTLTLGNTMFSGGSSSTWYQTIGTLGFTSGKYYWEAKYNAGTNLGKNLVGVVGIDGMSSGKFYEKTPSFFYKNEDGGEYRMNNVQSNLNCGTLAQNDILGFSIDMDASPPTARAYKNGTALFGNIDLTSFAGQTIVPAVSTYSSGEFQMNFGNGYFGTSAITTNSGNGYAGAEGASKFNYQPPTGYSALNTKGLNQ